MPATLALAAGALFTAGCTQDGRPAQTSDTASAAPQPQRVEVRIRMPEDRLPGFEEMELVAIIKDYLDNELHGVTTDSSVAVMAEGYGIIILHGMSADTLAARSLPILRGFTLPGGSQLVKRYGGDNAETTVVELAP